MASLLIKAAANRSIKQIVRVNQRYFSKVSMGDPVEIATGIEKRELLARMGGNTNLYDSNVMTRGPGTKNNPNEIPSAFDERLVGCLCDEEVTVPTWMWVTKGEPRRCECGFWFVLVHKAPL